MLQYVCWVALLLKFFSSLSHVFWSAVKEVNNDTELSDTEELIIDPTVEENPSLTLEFTMKVCLSSLPPSFLWCWSIQCQCWVENFYPAFGIRLFVTLWGSCPLVTRRRSGNSYKNITRHSAPLKTKTCWTWRTGCWIWARCRLCRSPWHFWRRWDWVMQLINYRRCVSEVRVVVACFDLTEP